MSKATELADVLDLLWIDGQTPRQAAAELRRLDSVNKALLEALKLALYGRIGSRDIEVDIAIAAIKQAESE